MSLVLIFPLFLTLYQCSEICTQRCESLSFDDIQLASLYGNITHPYHGYIFERDDPTWSVRQIGVINTSFRETLGPFSTAARSKPNVIVTSTDTLIIYRAKKEEPFFDAISFHAHSIMMDLRLSVEWGRTGRATFDLKRGETTLIIINQTKISLLRIGCAKIDLDTCGIVTYDDFYFCA